MDVRQMVLGFANRLVNVDSKFLVFPEYVQKKHFQRLVEVTLMLDHLQTVGCQTLFYSASFRPYQHFVIFFFQSKTKSNHLLIN